MDVEGRRCASGFAIGVRTGPESFPLGALVIAKLKNDAMNSSVIRLSLPFPTVDSSLQAALIRKL